MRRGASETAILTRQKAIDSNAKKLITDNRCNSLYTQTEKAQAINRLRRHAREQLSQYLICDGFLDVNKLSKSDKELLLTCIDDEQIQQFKDAFAAFDTNGDDGISNTEFRVILKSLGLDPTEDILMDVLSHIDSDGNGILDVEEFLVFMASRTLYKDDDQNIIDAFKQFDRDGNGYIDRDELIFLMESLGQNMTEDEIDEMIKDADFNRDGKISFQEFYIMMKLAC